MSPSVSLGDLRAAYKRTSNRVYRILEDGYDFAVADVIIDTLDRDALIIDAAFFVLLSGQIEIRINEPATRRMTTDPQRRALREQKFERRMGLALPGPKNEAVRTDIADWYILRNDAARGERLTEYNIEKVLEGADQLEAMLAQGAERLQS